MPLTRSRADEGQRTDAIDFLRTNNSAFSNLELALRAFLFGPQVVSGVVHGGGLAPTGPASMNVALDPLAAIVSLHLCIASEQQILAIAPADPTHPRIDLISIGYSEQNTDTEARWKKISGVNVQTPVATQIKAIQQAVVTTGVPAASPASPSVPAGHIPLWTVRVPAGATAVDVDDFTRADTSRIDRFRYVSWAAPTPPTALPYDGTEMTVTIPDGSVALLIGVAGLALQDSQPLRAKILVDGVALPIGGEAGLAGYDAQDLTASGDQHLVAVGIGTSTGVYKLRLERQSVGGGFNAWALNPGFLAAVVL